MLQQGASVPAVEKYGDTSEQIWRIQRDEVKFFLNCNGMLTLFGTIVRVGITEVGTMQTLSIFAASFYLFFLGQLAARLTLRAWQRVGILQIGGMSFWSVAHCLLFVGEFCTSIPPAINRNRVFPICDNVANYQLPPDIMLVGICNILMSTMIYRLPTALMLITAFFTVFSRCLLRIPDGNSDGSGKE